MASAEQATSRSTVAFGPLHAAAWAGAIVCFWRHGVQRSAVDPGSALDIVDLTPRPNAGRLLLREIAQQAGVLELGFEPHVRYTSCEDPSVSAAVRCVARRLSGGNPVVILVNGAWRRWPQRLLAMHYGSLLEADPARLTTTKAGKLEQGAWRPVAMDSQWGDHLRSALAHYHAALNSSPVVLAEGAQQLLDVIAGVGCSGYLVLSMDSGHVTDRRLRLCSFDELLAIYQRERHLPVNFHLLAAQFRDAGAVTWERELVGKRAIQVAVGGMPDMHAALEDVIVPVRDGRFADAELLARSAAVVSASGSEADAVLALLRQSNHEPAVLLAACPNLLRMLPAVAERSHWADALARVWRNRHALPGATNLYREIARAGMQLAEWGLARDALRWGRRVHGEMPDDVALLAWCEANTGRLEQLQLLMGNLTAQKEPRDAAITELLRRLQSRFIQTQSEPWRQPIKHAARPLVLEPLNPEHAFALHHQYRDPQIAQMTGLGELRTVADVRQWIETRRGNPQYADYAVMHRDAGFVGCVGLRVFPPSAGLVFWMGADHQGKGFGTEAGRLLCMWAKSQGLGWIFASAYRDNVRSLRALERIGFSRLGAPAVTTDDQRVFLACPADRDEQATAHAFKAYRESETQ